MYEWKTVANLGSHNYHERNSSNSKMRSYTIYYRKINFLQFKLWFHNNHRSIKAAILSFYNISVIILMKKVKNTKPKLV